MQDTPKSTDNFPTDDPTWTLDPIFEGGAQSETFAAYLDEAESRIEAYARRVDDLTPLREADGPDGVVVDGWVELLEQRQSLADILREAGAFARAQASAHATDPEASVLPGTVGEIQSAMEGVEADVLGKLQEATDEQFDWLAGREELEGLDLYVHELRRDARKAMAPEMEGLAAALNRDGLHAWGEFYNRLAGTLTAEVEDPETGDIEEMSVGQAKNRLSEPDRDQRRAAFEGLQRAWGGEAPSVASVLNHIVGAKETMIEHRDVDLLSDPLEQNRIERGTLEAMLEAADAMAPTLHEYLELKQGALGVDQLEWFDLNAPVGEAPADGIPYTEAQTFIVENVDAFSERMGEFYRRMLANQWVEAEDRGGKAPGGYCTGFPETQQMRIFMTYGGTMSGVLTLAHELGHAYHGWQLMDLPAGARQLPMTLAESASTLSEKLVESAAIERAEEEEKLRLLDRRLGRAVTFLIGIPARFRLEKAMHEARREGTLRPDQLCATVEEIFGEAYGGKLGSLDPYHWASKLHYFITRLPFYNFPYTFGYLFSKALYDRAVEGDEVSAATIDELLADTGKYTAEDLADAYLGVDLTEVGFWKEAASSIEGDVELYRELLSAS